MEATFFKYAFILLIGLAVLGITAMGITVIVLGLKTAWVWLRPHGKTANTKHV